MDMTVWKRLIEEEIIAVLSRKMGSYPYGSILMRNGKKQ